jgi:Acyltransferase family
MTTSNRLYFLDNLRAFVIILVVVLHGSMTYMAYAPTWWYVVDPNNNEVFTQLVLLLDVPIMPILFFLAGYFALPSLQKRGVKLFLKEKFIRVGIPWIFGALFLAPLSTYMIYFSRGVPMGFLEFWATDFWGKMYQQSVYWFLGILMFLFLGLGFAYSQSDRLRTSTRQIAITTRKPFVVFAAIMTLAVLAINLLFHVDNWSHIYLLVFQPVRVPLYIGYFILGLYAERHSWFMKDGFNPELGPWAATCFITGLGYLAVRWTAAAPDILLKMITGILFNVFCLSALITGVMFFKHKVNSAGVVWSSLAANSYGIYYVHPLILYPLAYAFVGLSLPLIVKAPALIGLALLLSWAISAWLLKRIPVLREMF